MSHELLDQVRDAKTVEDMHRALDALYGDFTRQIDDLDLVAEVVDDDNRFSEINEHLVLLKRSCDHARSFLTKANAPIAVPLAKALVAACVAAAAFAGALSPAAAEAVTYRKAKRDGAAGARAVRSEKSQIINLAVTQARQHWLASNKARPRSSNSFAVKILEDVNERITKSGSSTVVGESTVAKRLKKIDREEAARRDMESLFG